ncbi:hypothetical protein GWN26_11960 [Candidatus Saccharibacteria bacterium]|nr:hypothetical protein [Candidatus Saccharibacteria bacterium]
MGTILAENDINISKVSSGRVKEDKMAVNIFNVEGKWNKDLQKKIESIEHVKRAIFIDN